GFGGIALRCSCSHDVLTQNPCELSGAATPNNRGNSSQRGTFLPVDAVGKSNSCVVTEFDRRNYTFSVEETEDPHEGRPMDHFGVHLKETLCDLESFRLYTCLVRLLLLHVIMLTFHMKHSLMMCSELPL
ncbi:hypothetical protein L195_g046557, partial [Trifolium pratense]